MNTDQRRTIIWLVRVVTWPLLISMVWRADRGLLVYVLPAAVLLLISVLAEAALRRNGITFFRGGVLVLIGACACSLAIGNSPGLFLPSLFLSALAVVVVALVAGAVSGPSATFIARASLVLFCFAAGAAWQLGAVPTIASVLVVRR